MDIPSEKMQDLARRLLAVEAAYPYLSPPQVPAAVRVCEKLRISLTRFAGEEGFAALLRRAVAMAHHDLPQPAKPPPGSVLQSLDAIAVNAADEAPELTLAVLAHLLGLLTTFIGEPLTLRLVREAWPDGSWDEQPGRIENL